MTLKLSFVLVVCFVNLGYSQQTKDESSCNLQPIVNYNFGSRDGAAVLVEENGRPNVAQGRPGRVGPPGSLGPKGQKGERGQSDDTRQDLREIQSQVDDIKRRNDQEKRHADNLTMSLLRGYLELDDGWVAMFNGYQYKENPTAQSWDNARRTCQSWGGDLIANGFSNMETKIKLKKALRLPDEWYWIGLNDKLTEGLWNWINGRRANRQDVTVWRLNEPNGGDSSDCARASYHISSVYRFLVADTSCSYSYRSICEKEV